MKLLLTSAGFKNVKIREKFLELSGKPGPKIKVIFIPTAAITKEEKYYIGVCRKELSEAGIISENVKTLNLDHEVLYEEVDNFDVIYVCGGNTFYLLSKVKESGFDKIIKKFLEADKLYLGVSAGSILMGPNIEISKYLADKNDLGLTDLTGLKYIDSAICPHFQNKDKNKFDNFKSKVNYPILPLNDDQALLVLGKEEKIIE